MHHLGKLANEKTVGDEVSLVEVHGGGLDASGCHTNCKAGVMTLERTM